MARKVNQNRKEKTLKTQLSCNYEYFISVKTIGRQWLSEFFTDDYFLRPRRLRRLASAAGFSECHTLAVDLYEDIRQPVLNIVLPAWFQRLVQKYTIYIIKP